MAHIDEQLSRRFLSWERRCRGWELFDHPVYPEPTWMPFPGSDSDGFSPVDDGRRPTLGASLIRRIAAKLSSRSESTQSETEISYELTTPIERDAQVELTLAQAMEDDGSPHRFRDLLTNLSSSPEPIAFEIQGTSSQVLARLACNTTDAACVQSKIETFIPSVVCTRHENTLSRLWETERCSAVFELGLRGAAMLPLATPKLDPFVGLVGALSNLGEDEVGLYQVLFERADDKWAESLERSTSRYDGSPFFVNAPELLAEAKRKASQPLYAAVVRIVTCSETFERAWEIARNMAASLRVLSHPRGNELLPLKNDGYPSDDHIEDTILRQSRRSGMLLTLDELLSLVHLPSEDVKSPKLVRQYRRTKVAPGVVAGVQGIELGVNTHNGIDQTVRLSAEQRTRHIHIVGGSGTGKSTLLSNLIRQDIEAGEGVAVLDPHGELIDQLLGVIPENRINDVVLLDPSDEDYSVGFNILSAHSDLEKALLASDLVSVFQRLSTSWGDQMGSVLNNAILAFLESSQGGTLAELRQFLIEPQFRERFLQTVRDPDVVYYWKKAFAQLTGNKSVGPITTRLDAFLSPKPIRRMVSQRENRLDFSDIIDSGKIFLARIPQGAIGQENSFLLGSLILAKFQQTAMSRQRLQREERRNFWIYCDEFQHFRTPSMAEILSSTRKYRVGLTLAHQDLKQIERDAELAGALSNCGVRIYFRVGDNDARTLSQGLSFFEAKDLQNQDTGNAICRVERRDFDFNLSVPLPEPASESFAAHRRQQVIDASRARYAKHRSELERPLTVIPESQPNNIAEAPEFQASKPTAPNKKLTSPSVAAATEVLSGSNSVQSLDLAPRGQPDQSEESSAGETDEPGADKVQTSALKLETSTGPEPGIGGAQHKAIQRRIKEAAEKLGFAAKLEVLILDRTGKVDIVLSRDDIEIACEISVTCPVDHEVQNAKKCIRAGFTSVVSISSDPIRLEKIKRAVSRSLAPNEAAKVHFFEPSRFIEYLGTFPHKAPADSETKIRRRGYKVTRVVPVLSADEEKARENAAIQTIAQAMMKKANE